MVYRLFLSHSSPSDEDKQRLQDLAAAIEGAVREGEQGALRRRTNLGGDDWRKRIAFMLHVCLPWRGSAFNEAAVESKWVLAEATVVSLRHAYDEKFVCVPVSFLDEPDLEKSGRSP